MEITNEKDGFIVLDVIKKMSIKVLKNIDIDFSEESQVGILELLNQFYIDHYIINEDNRNFINKINKIK